jgi:multiple sugar transport system substrate-binding protein
MQMSHKKLSILLIGVTLLVFAYSQAIAAPKATLKFSSFQSGDVEKDWKENRFPDYEKETGVRVEHVFINHGDTISTLLTWIAGGTAPDAAMLSAQYQNALAAKGALVNLSELVARIDPTYDFSDFWPKLLDTYKYQEDIYALPSDLDLGLLWYNEELFDSAGVAYPDDTWTWDEYLAAAKKLTTGRGPGRIYGTAFPDYTFFLWQNGADILSSDGKEVVINSPEAIEAIQFLADLISKHEVAPNPLTAGQTGDLFQMGKAAMTLGPGPWYAHYVLEDVDFKWNTAPLPRNKTKATLAWGSSFGILSSSENKEEAWEFIKWFLSPEQQFIRAKQFAWFPPGATALQMPGFESVSVMGMTAEQKELVMREVEFGRSVIVVENQNRISEIINRELSLVWAGEKSPEEAVTIIAKEVQPLL